MVASEINDSHKHKTIALFDVDGTLTVPRKVGIPYCLYGSHTHK